VRVAIVTNVTAPYRTELFRHVQPLVTDLRVFFQADTEPLRNWERRPTLPYAHDYLKSFTVRLGSRKVGIFGGLGSQVVRRPWDVLVCYGFSMATVACCGLARRRAIDLVIANDGTLETDVCAGPEFHYRRALVARASGYVAASTSAAEYFLKLGADPARVHVIPLTVDLAAIRDHQPSTKTVAHLRSKIGAGPIVLVAARLVPGKEILDACEAVHRVAQKISDIKLVIAGDGPMRDRVTSWKEAHDAEHVVLLGMAEWEQMLTLYKMADLVLFPARREKFGMVVIEGLAAGVPVIAYRKVGAARDLIRDGINGFLVDEGDVNGLAQRIEEIVGAPSLGCRLKEHAARVVEHHDVRVEARRFVDALHASLALRREGAHLSA